MLFLKLGCQRISAKNQFLFSRGFFCSTCWVRKSSLPLFEFCFDGSRRHLGESHQARFVINLSLSCRAPKWYLEHENFEPSPHNEPNSMTLPALWYQNRCWGVEFSWTSKRKHEFFGLWNFQYAWFINLFFKKVNFIVLANKIVHFSRKKYWNSWLALLERFKQTLLKQVKLLK